MKIKKMLILICIMTQHVNAATLKCENYKAYRISSAYVSSGIDALSNMELTGIVIGTPKIKNFHVTITYSDTSVGKALAGNFIHIYPHLAGVQSAPIITGEKLTGLSGQTISIPCTSSVSNGCAMKNHNWAPIVSANASSVSSASINSNITVPAYRNAISTTFKITSNNIQVSDQTVNTSADLLGKSIEEDSLTIPDSIDLGSLTAGENKNAGAMIDYTNNKNNLNIRLSPSYEASALLTVNAEQVHSAAVFKPPFTLGLYVMPSAQPGTKSVNVIASWTCP